MNESTKKRRSYNAPAVHIVADKFGFTHRYVRDCLRGTRAGVMADRVKKAYKEADQKIKETEKQLKEQ